MPTDKYEIKSLANSEDNISLHFTPLISTTLKVYPEMTFFRITTSTLLKCIFMKGNDFLNVKEFCR